MKRCDPRAYAQCPDRERCGLNIHTYFTEGSECDKFNQRVLEAPMTNADRIRAMNDEELAAAFADAVYYGVTSKKCNDRSEAIDAWIDWLKQPAKEDNNGEM